MDRFSDHNVIITGAAAGIGRATCLRIASEGGRIVAIDVDAAGLAETVELVGKQGGGITALQCDIGDPAAVSATMEKAVAELGEVHALCNIAGVLATGHSHDYPLEDWERILRINLTGTFLMCQAAIPHLLKTKGCIVNTSSTAALGSHPWMAAYAASKGGVLSLTRSLAVEYSKQGMRANAVCPGGVATDIHKAFEIPEGADYKLIFGAMPSGDMASPADAAATIAFLASSDAKFMNGAELRVDGGALS